MAYNVTESAARELSSLIYWRAELSHTRERYPDELDEVERCKKTIELCIFPALDRLGVPFWVQNAALCWAEDWRNYVSRDFWRDMEKRGIVRAAA